MGFSTMPRRRPTEPTDTRERIADAALSLFNADGTPAVSTRHVAARLGISPGNLYYHFGNKEEIVLHLYERIETELQAILAPPAHDARTFEEVLGYLDAIFAHLWKFRFFYRDLNSLLRDVPGLKERYRRLAERVLARSKAIFTEMVQHGWMEASDEHLDLLVTNAWIVLTQWFTHRQVVERRRTIQSSDVREGIRHLVALFSPLLRRPQRRQIEELLAQDA
ncbi:MAG TPA: TetR/AcrR family transcriptional regulator [Steroidobacteraceae bacterium]|nr:TetR/AcrR family transcriptional regulator [Steroidobacteraceae bacterium]